MIYIPALLVMVLMFGRIEILYTEPVKEMLDSQKAMFEASPKERVDLFLDDCALSGLYSDEVVEWVSWNRKVIEILRNGRMRMDGRL